MGKEKQMEVLVKEDVDMALKMSPSDRSKRKQLVGSASKQWVM